LAKIRVNRKAIGEAGKNEPGSMKRKARGEEKVSHATGGT